MQRNTLLFASFLTLGTLATAAAAHPRDAQRAARSVGLRAGLAIPSAVKLAPLLGIVACEPNELSSDHAAEDLRFSVNVGTLSRTGATEVSVTAKLEGGGFLELDAADELFLEDDLDTKIPAGESTSVARLDPEQHPRVTFYRNDALIRTMPLPLVRVIAAPVADRAAYDIRLVGAGVSDLALTDSEGLPLRTKFVVEVDDANQAGDAEATSASALFASEATTRVPMAKECEACRTKVSVVLEGSAFTSSAGSWVTYSFNPSLVFEAPADPVEENASDAGASDADAG